MRHRNLLAMPVQSLLPADQAAGTGWFDLLPLLAHADVVCFGDSAALRGLGAGEFRAFYRRAQAVLERRNSAALVAGGV